MVKKEFVTLRLDELVPYENNPRKNEDAVPDVAESIKQCGDLDPIEIDEDNVILAGHTRLMALMEQGFTETDVIRYTGLTEEQKKKYRILSNKTGEKALWDFDALAEELEGLDFDDYDFGFATLEDDISTEIGGVDEHKDSMSKKYLVPPFSVLYGNKGDWLKRKRKWVDFGIRSEIGRGGRLTFNSWSDPEANFLRSGGGTSKPKPSRINTD